MSIGETETLPHRHSWEVIETTDGVPLILACDCGLRYAVCGHCISGHGYRAEGGNG